MLLYVDRDLDLLLLHDADMLAVGDRVSECRSSKGGPQFFGEDAQTFYVRETAPGEFNWGLGGYTAKDVGLPEWGFSHCGKPADDFAELITLKDGQLDARARKLLDMWPKTVELYAADEYVVKIRDKEIRTKLTSESTDTPKPQNNPNMKTQSIQIPKVEEEVMKFPEINDE